jgi:dTDP-4-amino-4,6-dideoxygalactose transaminase
VRHPARDRLRDHLEKRGIGTALHYPQPLHLQKCFAGLGHKPGDFPVAESAANCCLSLPVYPEISEAQIEYVAASIADFKGWK